MRKGNVTVIIVAIVGIALGSIFYFLPKFFEEKKKPVIIDSKPVPLVSLTEDPTKATNLLSTPSPDSDSPPLWVGVGWGEAEANTYFFTDLENETIRRDGFMQESVSSYDVDTAANMLYSYHDQLIKLGWTITSSAGGPNGEIFDYKMGDKFMRTRYYPKGNENINYFQIFYTSEDETN